METKREPIKQDETGNCGLVALAFLLPKLTGKAIGRLGKKWGYVPFAGMDMGGLLLAVSEETGERLRAHGNMTVDEFRVLVNNETEGRFVACAQGDGVRHAIAATQGAMHNAVGWRDEPCAVFEFVAA